MSLTTITALGGKSSRVHVGEEEGSYDSVPLCGSPRREWETTDQVANCPRCKTLAMREYGDIGLWEREW